jgi:hypothetical protein
VASTVTAGGGVTAVVVIRWHDVVAEVVTTILAVVRPPTQRYLPTMEWEVASPSVSYSWREGWEEAAMEWMSTMVLILEHQER